MKEGKCFFQSCRGVLEVRSYEVSFTLPIWVWQKWLSLVPNHFSLTCSTATVCAGTGIDATLAICGPLSPFQSQLSCKYFNCLQTCKTKFATSFKYQQSCQYYQKSIYCTMKRIVYASFSQTILLCSCILRVALLKHCWCSTGCAFKLLCHVVVHQVKSVYLMNFYKVCCKSVHCRNTIIKYRWNSDML